MSRRSVCVLRCVQLFVVSLIVCAGTSRAQTTSFTYQGRLQDSGSNAIGSYDFQFTLWDALSGGTQQPQPSSVTVTKTSVAVANGVFTVQLDFGATAFPGADRWLETSVRLAGGGTFTVLSPRQPITSTPYAIRSASAASADSLPVTAVPAGSGNYIQNSTSQQASSNFNISGNGTAGGTLSGNVVNTATQYNIGGNRVLSTAGTNNIFAGIGAGTNTTGGFNSFFGSRAGAATTSGTANSFFGSSAGFSLTTGANNSFFGQGAGGNSTTAQANSFFGYAAGVGNTTGSDNSFFGNIAGLNTTSGAENSFFGEAAGSANTIGGQNTFVGNGAGSSSVSGIRNSIFGYLAGDNQTTGNFNTLIGSAAGAANVTGNNNTALGWLATFGGSNLTNAAAIGANAQVNQSNALVLGSINGINSAAASTNVGIGTTTPNARLHVVGDTNLVGNLTVSGTLNAAIPAGSANYIQNTTSPQASSNFNISGTGGVQGGFAVGPLAPVAGSFIISEGSAGAGTVATVAGSNTVTGTNTQFTTFFHIGDSIVIGGATQGVITNIVSNTQLTVNFPMPTTGSGLAYASYTGTAITVTSNGLVGIGATAISNRLQVLEPSLSSPAGSFSSFAQTGSSNGLFVQAGTNASDVSFSARNKAGNPLLLVRGDGAVGIGTSNPGAAVEVQRNSTVAADWQTGQLRISGASDPSMQLSLGYDTSSNLGVIQAGQAGVAFKNLSLNPSGGNVGIGTAAPQSKLHVNGVIRMDALGSPAGVFPLCWNVNDQIASCTSSSLRYKTGVKSFTGGLEIINRLRPISFTWRDGGIHDVGLAAEEVEKVEPLLAYRNKQGEVEGVRYNQLSAVFINAFKEQQAQISQQQEQIKRQQDRAKQQSAELRAQQQQLEELKKLVCRSHRRANVCR